MSLWLTARTTSRSLVPGVVARGPWAHSGSRAVAAGATPFVTDMAYQRNAVQKLPPRARGPFRSAAKAAAKAAANKAVHDVYLAKIAVDDAAVAKRKADEDAVQKMKRADEQEASFLKNAFQTFDTKKVGFLTTGQMEKVLKTLKLPADNGCLDRILQALDTNKDTLIQDWEWVNHMPREMMQALENHKYAHAWTTKCGGCMRCPAARMAAAN